MLSHLSWPHRLTTSTVHFVTTTSLSHGPSEESGIEPGPIATITGSFVSNPDTDHTDLVSEIDEAEIRRQLLRDQWRQFFDKFDPEGFGEIPWAEFLNVLNRPEFRQRVDSGKREIFLEKARNATTPAITYQDFVNVRNHPPMTLGATIENMQGIHGGHSRKANAAGRILHTQVPFVQSW
ncbi:stet [Trypoxylus dichotomus]